MKLESVGVSFFGYSGGPSASGTVALEDGQKLIVTGLNIPLELWLQIEQEVVKQAREKFYAASVDGLLENKVIENEELKPRKTYL